MLTAPQTGVLFEGPQVIEDWVWWVDIQTQSVHAWNLETHKHVTLQVDAKVTSLVLIDTQLHAIHKQGTIHINTDDLTVRDGLAWNVPQPFTSNDYRSNDALMLNERTLLLGIMKDPPSNQAGCLLKIQLNTDPPTVSVAIDNVTISNGMALTNNGKLLHFIDTPTREIKRFHVNTNSLQPLDTINLSSEAGEPDGMTATQDGHLYVAMWGGSQIIKINPETQQVTQRLPIPSKYVTSTTLTNNDATIIVTTASNTYGNNQTTELPKEFDAMLHAISN